VLPPLNEHSPLLCISDQVSGVYGLGIPNKESYNDSEITTWCKILFQKSLLIQPIKKSLVIIGSEGSSL
jgi:hypothetical protein